MLKIIKSKVDDETLKQVAEDLEGYIKVVVDINKKILTAGGLRHFEGEELLLKDGSKQSDLWGGGLDLETEEVDYDSMINIRPNQGNTSREVLSLEIRGKMNQIIRDLLK
jgi:hypothetical protein